MEQTKTLAVSSEGLDLLNPRIRVCPLYTTPEVFLLIYGHSVAYPNIEVRPKNPLFLGLKNGSTRAEPFFLMCLFARIRK